MSGNVGFRIVAGIVLLLVLVGGAAALGWTAYNMGPAQGAAQSGVQIEPQAAIAVAKGFGREILKPYGSEIGMPVKVVTMTAKFHDERRTVAAKAMQAFVEATKLFLEKPDVPRKFYSEVVFKGNLTPQEYDAAVANSPFSVDVTVEHVQQTIDAMMKYGVGRMTAPPAAKDFVKLDLLVAAKKALGMK